MKEGEKGIFPSNRVRWPFVLLTVQYAHLGNNGQVFLRLVIVAVWAIHRRRRGAVNVAYKADRARVVSDVILTESSRQLSEQLV